MHLLRVYRRPDYRIVIEALMAQPGKHKLACSPTLIVVKIEFMVDAAGELRWHT